METISVGSEQLLVNEKRKGEIADLSRKKKIQYDFASRISSGTI